MWTTTTGSSLELVVGDGFTGRGCAGGRVEVGVLRAERVGGNVGVIGAAGGGGQRLAAFDPGCVNEVAKEAGGLGELAINEFAALGIVFVFEGSAKIHLVDLFDVRG